MNGREITFYVSMSRGLNITYTKSIDFYFMFQCFNVSNKRQEQTNMHLR